MKPQLWVGEAFRWYVTRARHPFKGYVVGHYWRWFCKHRVWIRYGEKAAINVTLGDYLQQKIFFEGYYERPLIEWLRKSLRPDDVFWDVGANIGAIALVAAEHCRRVVAFEPDPRSFDWLQKNLRANEATNVQVVARALGDRTGSATLHQSAPGNTGMTSLASGRGTMVGTVEVAVTRADDFLLERPELSPTVIKIDVEGTEHMVLAGASALLRSGRVRAIVFESARDGDGNPANRDAVACLTGAGYVIEPFGPSDIAADDVMFNFMASRAVATGT